VERDPFADAIHVALQVRVGVQGCRAEEARRERVAQADLVFLGEFLAHGAALVHGLAADVEGLADVEPAELRLDRQRRGEERAQEHLFIDVLLLRSRRS
jgi:hypothetical protein